METSNTNKQPRRVFHNTNANVSNWTARPDLNTDMEARLEASFAKLSTLENNNDIVGLKTLLTMIAKSLIICAKCRPEKKQQLQAKVFDAAFVKLPVGKQEYYDHLVGRGVRAARSLLDLRKFVQDEIILYSKLINSGQLVADMSKAEAAVAKRSKITFGRGETGTRDRPICSYCRLPGHIKVACAERNAVLCMRCLVYGHNRNHCNGPMRQIQLADIEV